MNTNEIPVNLDSLNLEELKKVRMLVGDVMLKHTNNSQNGITIDDMLSAKFNEQVSLADLRTMTIRYLLGQGIESADGLWYRLPVKKVFRDTIGEDVEYAILLEDNLEIKLNAEALTRDSLVINEIFKATGITLPHPKSQCWNLWRMYITSISVPRHNLGSLETNDVRIQEIVRNYIETASITDSFEAALRYGYIVVTTDNILIYNRQIQTALEAQLKKVDYESAAKALKGTLLKSEPRKIGKPSKAYRFWIFKKDAYTLTGTSVGDDGTVPPPSQQVRFSEPENHSTSLSKPDGLVTESGKVNEALPQGNGAASSGQPASHIQQPASSNVKPKRVDLGNTEGICPVCGCTTPELYVIGGGWKCKMCLKEAEGVR